MSLWKGQHDSSWGKIGYRFSAVLCRDVPLAKNPSTGTAQQRLFLVLKAVLHAVVVISEVLRFSTKSRRSRCCRAHLYSWLATVWFDPPQYVPSSCPTNQSGGTLQQTPQKTMLALSFIAQATCHIPDSSWCTVCKKHSIGLAVYSQCCALLHVVYSVVHVVSLLYV